MVRSDDESRETVLAVSEHAQRRLSSPPSPPATATAKIWPGYGLFRSEWCSGPVSCVGEGDTAGRGNSSVSVVLTQG